MPSATVGHDENSVSDGEFRLFNAIMVILNRWVSISYNAIFTISMFSIGNTKQNQNGKKYDCNIINGKITKIKYVSCFKEYLTF